MTYGGATYYYATNIQGDVVAILDSTGAAVVTYTYDAWGNILTTTGTLASTLGTHNPLRYRGYVYDLETGLYYLQSRYYNPEMGRFLNADALVSTGQGILGNNMFAYCLNNPVNLEDITGSAARICFSDNDRLDEAPWFDHSPGGGGRLRRKYTTGSNNYGEVADKFYTVRLLRTIGKGVGAGAIWLWDAYQRGYALEQETMMLQAKTNLDMFDSPEDIERSIDLIEATVGFSMAAYEVATIVTVTHPPAGAVIWAMVGLVWGGRAIYRALQ